MSVKKKAPAKKPAAVVQRKLTVPMVRAYLKSMDACKTARDRLTEGCNTPKQVYAKAAEGDLRWFNGRHPGSQPRWQAFCRANKLSVHSYSHEAAYKLKVSERTVYRQVMPYEFLEASVLKAVQDKTVYYITDPYNGRSKW